MTILMSFFDPPSLKSPSERLETGTTKRLRTGLVEGFGVRLEEQLRGAAKKGGIARLHYFSRFCSHQRFGVAIRSISLYGIRRATFETAVGVYESSQNRWCLRFYLVRIMVEYSTDT